MAWTTHHQHLTVALLMFLCWKESLPEQLEAAEQDLHVSSPGLRTRAFNSLSSLRFEWPQLCFPQSDARILTTKPLGWGLGRDGENKTSQDTGHWQNGMVRWSLGQSLSSTARPCSLISVVSVIRPRENPAPSADWLLYRNAKIIPVEFQRHFLNFFLNHKNVQT